MRTLREMPVPQSNEVALLVGAGDAIGAAVARRFATGGYKVCIARRDAAKSASLIEELRALRAEVQRLAGITEHYVLAGGSMNIGDAERITVYPLGGGAPIVIKGRKDGETPSAAVARAGVSFTSEGGAVPVCIRPEFVQPPAAGETVTIRIPGAGKQ